jgi:hypothetical protein
MSPFPPPMPATPDWRFQLMAAVVIVWVVVMYALLLWAEHRAGRRGTTVRCPERGSDAQVLVRLDYARRPAAVVRCSLLPPGAGCAEGCLPAIAR